MPKHPFLFNFAASPRGGGLKRLQEYSRWFDLRGGATFAVHHTCAGLQEQFPANQYFPVHQTAFDRLVQDGGYLEAIVTEMEQVKFYYAYGIPIYRPIADRNWFHLSNVMPFNFWRHRLPLLDYLKQPMLAWRYTRNLQNADIVSAESAASLKCLSADSRKLFVSVNGSDDELLRAAAPLCVRAEPIAIVVGTYSYKAITDSYQVYRFLRTREPGLKLIIIGAIAPIPSVVREDENVTCTGLLPRSKVMATLEGARYYISTTRLENSYNAASEGIFLARESFISAIPPHRELLAGQDIELVNVPSVRTPLIRVERDRVSTRSLKTWDQVVTEMLARAGLGDP